MYEGIHALNCAVRARRANSADVPGGEPSFRVPFASSNVVRRALGVLPLSDFGQQVDPAPLVARDRVRITRGTAAVAAILRGHQSDLVAAAVAAHPRRPSVPKSVKVNPGEPNCWRAPSLRPASRGGQTECRELSAH